MMSDFYMGKNYDWLSEFSDDEKKLQPVVVSPDKKEEKWLPVVRNFGEGIFIKFKLDKLKNGKKMNLLLKKCTKHITIIVKNSIIHLFTLNQGTF